ncbi:MAG: hypothetical protein AB7R90_03885 [Reyranellaceae bacterium]
MPASPTVRRLLVGAALLLPTLASPVRAQDWDSRTVSLVYDALGGETPAAGAGVDSGAIAKARAALQAENLLATQRVATVEPDVIDLYGRALQLGTRARQFLPELAEIRNAAIGRDRRACAAAIERLFVKAGRNKPPPEAMERYIDAVTGATSKEGPVETARKRIEKPGRTIEITDAKSAGLFTIDVTTAPPGQPPSRSVVVAERVVRPAANGAGLEQRAVAVRACTITAADAAQRRAALNGAWVNQNGEAWEISGSGSSITMVQRLDDGRVLRFVGTYVLGRAHGTHQVAKPDDVGKSLPANIRGQLVGRTSFVVRLDDCGDGRLRGTWESRHVSYSPAYGIIDKIHDPYDLALVLSRPGKVEVAQGGRWPEDGP